MAQKRGKFKKILLTVIFLALLIFVFILAGGGDFLKSAGKKIEGAGKQAEQIKEQVEEKASSVGKTMEKTVEKGLDTIKPGEKK